ncbi:MAG: dihydrodipicolinate synthase family protein [bacterium]|nr:dihydrodipicolinate synthase family protein [bacterium]
MTATVTEQRLALQRRFLGDPVPRLWCPPLSHYDSEGAFDRERMAAHWDHLASGVTAFLVPGSTGDAWELSSAETGHLLDLALDLAAPGGATLLLGALCPDAGTTLTAVDAMLAILRRRSGCDDPLEAMAACGVGAFTVCSPTGPDLAQTALGDDLARILDRGLPTALYQLPQITGNEMGVELVAGLAQEHPHLLLLKDSSGGDRLALETEGDLAGVFLVRGAEGGYAGWLREAGGPYDGLLLSTANAFPRELAAVIAYTAAARHEQARDISERLTRVVDAAFALVADLPDGNAFANANKLLDHVMALGSAAANMPAPRLHAGVRLPAELVLRVRDLLDREGFSTDRGYLTGNSI